MARNRRCIVLGGLAPAAVGAGMVHAASGPPGHTSRSLIAPTGRGQGVGAMPPNLLTSKGQIITIDVKGENAIIAGRQEEGPPHA